MDSFECYGDAVEVISYIISSNFFHLHGKVIRFWSLKRRQAFTQGHQDPFVAPNYNEASRMKGWSGNSNFPERMYGSL